MNVYSPDSIERVLRVLEKGETSTSKLARVTPIERPGSEKKPTHGDGQGPHHKQPKLCGSSLDFEFIRECMKINKIRLKIRLNY